jgi:hypothetical protein
MDGIPRPETAAHQAVRIQIEVAVRHRYVVMATTGFSARRLPLGGAFQLLRLLPGDVGGGDIGRVPAARAHQPTCPAALEPRRVSTNILVSNILTAWLSSP